MHTATARPTLGCDLRLPGYPSIPQHTAGSACRCYIVSACQQVPLPQLWASEGEVPTGETCKSARVLRCLRQRGHRRVLASLCTHTIPGAVVPVVPVAHGSAGLACSLVRSGCTADCQPIVPGQASLTEGHSQHLLLQQQQSSSSSMRGTWTEAVGCRWYVQAERTTHPHAPPRRPYLQGGESRPTLLLSRIHTNTRGAGRACVPTAAGVASATTASHVHVHGCAVLHGVHGVRPTGGWLLRRVSRSWCQA